jgi:F-type H+-transporting ATPase subunit b
MNINLTLVGQSIAFAVFVWFCLKFIWPPIITALNARKARIADGLTAADEGLKAKERADDEVAEALREVREQAKDIIANAQKRADQMVEEAKISARSEGDKLLELAKGDVEQQANEARENLRKDVVALALTGAEQVLMQEVDADKHTEALNKLSAQL